MHDSAQRPPFDDVVDELRLRFKDPAHELFQGLARHHVGDVHGARLANAVGAVLGLPVVGRHPVEIVENHLAGGGEVDADAGGVDLADEDAHRLVVLEAVHQRLALRRRHFAGHRHAQIAEGACETARGMGEAGEENHLLALLDGAAHEVQGLRHLGHRQAATRAREHGDAEPPAPLRALFVEESRHRAMQLVAHLVVDVHVDPSPLLRRQVQHVVLAPPQHDALQLHRQFLGVADAAGHPMAVVVLAPVAVAFGEGQKTAPEGVADQLQQREQVAWPVGERRAGEHVYRRVRCRFVDQTPRVDAALGAVVLDVVAFVEHQPAEALAGQCLEVAL